MAAMTMRVAVLVLAVLAVAAAVVDAHVRDYAGHALFKVHTEDPQHVLALLDRFDVWGRAPNGAYDVFAPKAEFLQFSQVNALRFEEVKADVMDAVRKEQERLAQPKKAEWFEEYHDFNATRSWYEDLASTYSQIATFVPSVGKTWEGRDIFAFRVTANRTTEHKKIWIQCNIHAREWITSATCQFFVNQILTRYGADAEVTELLEKIEFIFIPIVNPDGYSYTWTNDRLWRKNRRNNGLSYGVDLNRNYDQQWGGIGSSTSPTSETYCGPSAASEPEVQALAAYYNKEASSIIGAIDVHSYSQLILRPYTHTDVASQDEANLRKVSEDMASIIRAVHGTRFTPGTWFSGLYPSSGVAQDYYYVRGSFALTVELRPDSSFPGFVLPPDEIIPSGEELTPALLHFATFTLANNI